MNTMLRFFFLLGIFALTISLSPAQNQYNIWYWGGDINSPVPISPGLDFNQSNPMALTDCNMSGTEGCAVHCNSAGQLVCYANGDSIWNRNHDVMPNGRTLIADRTYSSKQSVLFVPSDLDSNRLTMFINSGKPTGTSSGIMGHTFVDLSLDGGLGDVTGPPDTLLSGTSEQLIAVKHINGKDHWVLSHLWNSNTYKAFLVTPCGISDTVTSTIGPVSMDFTLALSCPWKASPMGDKIAYYILDENIRPNTLLFDFDRATGHLTSYTLLDTVQELLGCGFSPDGSKLYYTETNFGGPIVQYDLTSPSIPASRTIVGEFNAAVGNLLLWDIQTGRDHKLYVAATRPSPPMDTIFVIQNPNVAGINCGFDSIGIPLLSRLGGLSLPNLITDYLNPLPVIEPTISMVVDSTICDTGMTGQFAASINFHAAYDSSNYSYTWNFGDPMSGTANNATGLSAAHIFSSYGTYNVTFTASDGCRSFSSEQIVDCESMTALPEPLSYQVYPVPAHEKVRIKGTGIESIELHDLTGRLLLREPVFHEETLLEVSQYAGPLILSISFSSGRRESRILPKVATMK